MKSLPPTLLILSLKSLGDEGVKLVLQRESLPQHSLRLSTE